MNAVRRDSDPPIKVETSMPSRYDEPEAIPVGIIDALSATERAQRSERLSKVVQDLSDSKVLKGSALWKELRGALLQAGARR